MLRCDCLLSVLSECRNLNSSKAAKTKAVNHTVHMLQDDLETWGQTYSYHKQMQVLQSTGTAPVCINDCFATLLIKSTLFTLTLTSTHFTLSSGISYISFPEKCIVAPSAASRTGEIQHSCSLLHFSMDHLYSFALLWLYNPGDCLKSTVTVPHVDEFYIFIAP